MIEESGQAGGIKPSKNGKRIELNIDMVRAGAAILKEWDCATEAEEIIVVEIFYRMLDCAEILDKPSSAFMDSSSF